MAEIPPPTDLTRRPPRSPRCRLGGYVLLPRMIDKGRAEAAGTAGEYRYNCPLDQRLLSFVGVEAEAFRQQIVAGLGDGELLAWFNAHRQRPALPHEIEAWSRHQESTSPGDLETRDFFQSLHRTAGASREDVHTWFDLLDLDDFASFGGRV